MGKKDNKRVEEEKQLLKTTELKNFVNVLKEVNQSISEDINKGQKNQNNRPSDVVVIQEKNKPNQNNNKKEKQQNNNQKGSDKKVQQNNPNKNNKKEKQQNNNQKGLDKKVQQNNSNQNNKKEKQQNNNQKGSDKKVQQNNPNQNNKKEEHHENKNNQKDLDKKVQQNNSNQTEETHEEKNIQKRLDDTIQYINPNEDMNQKELESRIQYIESDQNDNQEEEHHEEQEPVQEVKKQDLQKTGIIELENKNINEPQIKKIPKSRGFYFGFNARLTLNIILLIVFNVLFIYSFMYSFSLTKEELIKYRISSNIDYKVYLKPNDFYDTPYLEKGKAYVSSLIDKINVDYNYKFDISKDSNIDFDYKVIARLVIANKNNSNVFFDKEYVLTDSKAEKLSNGKSFSIDEETVVNYSYYNNLANKFRSKYAVDTNSYLDVYLLVNEKNSEDSAFKLDNKSTAILTIPLSMQEVNINIDEDDINENNQIISGSRLIVNNYGYVIISAMLLFVIIILVCKLVGKVLLVVNTNSRYDSYVNKILRGYDRIIVNIKTAPILRNYNVIKVENFQELVDVRDNYKAPINYYVISKHQKCEFFVINNKNIYVYIVKAIDLEKGK